MMTPLVLRSVAVKIYPEPAEIRVNMFAIGPGKLTDYDRERDKLKKK